MLAQNQHSLLNENGSHVPEVRLFPVMGGQVGKKERVMEGRGATQPSQSDLLFFVVYLNKINF